MLRIGNYFEGIRDANEIMRVSRQFPNVVSCSPVLRGTLSARAGFENATVDLFGIDPPLHLQTTDLGQQIVDGNFDDFRNNPNSVIVGSRSGRATQRRTSAIQCSCSRPGANIAVSQWPPSRAAAWDRWTPAGFTATSALRRSLLHKPFAASMIIYKLRDPTARPGPGPAFRRAFSARRAKLAGARGSTLQLFLTLRMSAAITVSLNHSAGRIRNL